jgi:hypothetical protein
MFVAAKAHADSCQLKYLSLKRIDCWKEHVDANADTASIVP